VSYEHFPKNLHKGLLNYLEAGLWYPCEVGVEDIRVRPGREILERIHEGLGRLWWVLAIKGNGDWVDWCD
jgi:hypothetical protein